MTTLMTHDDMTVAILTAKKASGMSWEAIAETVGMSPVFVHSACTGMNTLPAEKAKTLGETLGLSDEVVEMLQECPSKDWSRDIPTDPCVYRLYEIAGVYGPSFKALVHEKFGDGIMSAIDFDMWVEKVEDPKGDRVKLSMTGKFLPYKQW